MLSEQKCNVVLECLQSDGIIILCRATLFTGSFSYRGTISITLKSACHNATVCAKDALQRGLLLKKHRFYDKCECAYKLTLLLKSIKYIGGSISTGCWLPYREFVIRKPIQFFRELRSGYWNLVAFKVLDFCSLL